MKILLPVDGSAPSLAAVHHALELARAGLAAELVLVNVQEPPSLYEVAVAHDAERLQKLRVEAGEDLLRPAEALIEASGLEFESEVAGGEPANVLLEVLENYGCRAVILGARGMGDPDTAGLGSVAQAMLAHAGVPVTIVRAPSAET
jgi:nucleotide-binding universal stress UspA family protein